MPLPCGAILGIKRVLNGLFQGFLLPVPLVTANLGEKSLHINPACKTHWISSPLYRVDNSKLHQRSKDEDCAGDEPYINELDILHPGHLVIDVLVKVDEGQPASCAKSGPS